MAAACVEVNKTEKRTIINNGLLSHFFDLYVSNIVGPLNLMFFKAMSVFPEEELLVPGSHLGYRV